LGELAPAAKTGGDKAAAGMDEVKACGHHRLGDWGVAAWHVDRGADERVQLRFPVLALTHLILP